MAAGALLVVRRLSDRPIKFGGRREQTARQRMQVRTHDADHGVWPRAERDRLADNLRVARETLLPQRIAQHCDVIFAVDLFFRREDATKDWLRANDIEK